MSKPKNGRDILKPAAGKSFDQLLADLRPRPRYLGPGKWKQTLKNMLAKEERPLK